MHKSKGFFMGDSEFLYVLASKWGGGNIHFTKKSHKTFIPQRRKSTDTVHIAAHYPRHRIGKLRADIY